MKPNPFFTQPFEKLPDELPIYPLDNALLPGGQLPLELSEHNGLAMFPDVLKTDQLIGIVQRQDNNPESNIYYIGCAGRIRQYRERSDGRLNVMLTGVCRYKIVEELPPKNGYRIARIDWNDYKNDYEKEDVDTPLIDDFKARLRNYFERHNMQVDWKVLDERHIEEVVSNLILVINLNVSSKQRLLESPTVTQRLQLFSELLEEKPNPILARAPDGKFVN